MWIDGINCQANGTDWTNAIAVIGETSMPCLEEATVGTPSAGHMNRIQEAHTALSLFSHDGGYHPSTPQKNVS